MLSHIKSKRLYEIQNAVFRTVKTFLAREQMSLVKCYLAAWNSEGILVTMVHHKLNRNEAAGITFLWIRWTSRRFSEITVGSTHVWGPMIHVACLRAEQQSNLNKKIKVIR